ncbi:MAG: Hsp20/alpha crystallin family protein [Vicinamibacterales bacterium]
MAEQKDGALAEGRAARDPFALLRQMTSELDRVFDEPFGTAVQWPSLRALAVPDGERWAPQIDVFERDNRLVTKVDLPGLKKEDVKVEVTDGHLSISGERRSENREEKDNVYRSERSYGSFYRAVPLPEGAKIEDVKATFADGVLEVSVPLPAKVEATRRSVRIEDGKAARSAAA